MPTTVRPWQPQDRAAIVALNAELQEHERMRRPSRLPGPAMTEAYMAELEAHLARKGADGALLVAEDEGGQVLGFATCFVEEDELEQEPRLARIEDLVVAAPARRRGIARALVAEACRFARGRDAGRIVLSVLTSNVEAAAAYRRLGFRPFLVTLERSLAGDGQREP